MVESAWVPGWHELDQSLEVGMSGEFYFWRVVPEGLHVPQALVFYNALWNPAEMVVASGAITEIRHPVLGALRKVDTIGLDYTFVLANGTELEVNAEEEPGKLYEREGKVNPAVGDWALVVVFRSLSELKPPR
jgi:hypothetical protein